MNPEELLSHGPESADDLIGKARKIAKVFVAKAKSTDASPMKLLLYGPPGIGKSAVSRIIAQALLGRNMSMVRHVSAKQVSVDDVRDWMRDFHYKLGDDWSVFWIEEIDAVNSDVATLLLQFMDEMPKKTAIIFTSNEKITAIEGRFQSRTKAVRVDPPTAKEIEDFLLEKWVDLGEVAKEISENCGGDVRMALNDAQMHLDVQKYKE